MSVPSKALVPIGSIIAHPPYPPKMRNRIHKFMLAPRESFLPLIKTIAIMLDAYHCLLVLKRTFLEAFPVFYLHNNLRTRSLWLFGKNIGYTR